MPKPRYVYVILHYWPHREGYTVMPEAHKTKKGALARAECYVRNEQTLGRTACTCDEHRPPEMAHAYAIKALELEP